MLSERTQKKILKKLLLCAPVLENGLVIVASSRRGRLRSLSRRRNEVQDWSILSK